MFEEPLFYNNLFFHKNLKKTKNVEICLNFPSAPLYFRRFPS